MSRKAIIGNVTTDGWKPCGYFQVTNRAGVYAFQVTDFVGPTGATGTGGPTLGKFLQMQSETTTARFTDVTSVSPSTAVGMIINPNQTPVTYVGPIEKLNFWVTAGTINLNLYR